MYAQCSPSMENQKPHSRPASEAQENPPIYPVPPKGHKEVRLVAVRKQRRSSDTSDYQAYREKQKKWDYHYKYRRNSDSDDCDEYCSSPGRGYRNFGVNSDPEDYDDHGRDASGSSGRREQPSVVVASPKLTKFSQLRKLHRRATVAPVLEHYHQENASGEHLPMRTFAVARSSNEIGGPSTSQINKCPSDAGLEQNNNTNGSQGEAEITSNVEEEEEPLTEKFRDIVREATTLLDEITQRRKRRPWWEKLLMYLRCLWLGDDARPRRTSKLLFWHIDPRGGEHITTIPRSNGEYIVTINEIKPEPKQQNSIKAFFSAMQDVALDRDPNFVRLNSPPDRHNAPFNKRTPPSERRKRSLYKRKRYPSFRRY